MAEGILLVILVVVCLWIKIDLVVSVDLDALPNVKKTWLREMIIRRLQTRVVEKEKYFEVQVYAPIVGWRRTGVAGWHHPLARVYKDRQRAETARSQLEHMIAFWLKGGKQPKGTGKC